MLNKYYVLSHSYKYIRGIWICLYLFIFRQQALNNFAFALM